VSTEAGGSWLPGPTNPPNGTTQPADDWRKRLIRNKSGDPKALLANAMTALRGAPEWTDVLAFNEFTISTVMKRSPVFGGQVGADWTDQEDRLTADWLQHNGISISVEVAGQAVQAVARDRSFHPVREYLASLKWDGTKRAAGWLNLYLGVEPSDYSMAVGERYLRSAIARVMQPGCKADCCLILEGEQGIKKSTALKTLGQPWFTDEIADLGSKDAALQTRGVWVIEIAELDGMTRAEVGKIKAFMSRAIDRFRPPYGRHLLESPRQCVFAGSVNHGAYLRDATGGRRFWPVACTRVLIEDLARDRDQLWAETMASYSSGLPWWLDTPELNRQAEDEQSQRFEESAWDGLILDWAAGRLAVGFDSVSIAEVLDLCIHKRLGEWTRADEMRVGDSLRRAGWKRTRERTSGGLQWRYKPPCSYLVGTTPQGRNTAND
jgi:predicted P-loop ATPase